MAFYVPLGPRGILFRLGTFIIGIWGGMVYGLAYRRRALVLGNPGPFSTIGLGAGTYTGLEETSLLPEMLVPLVILGESETAAAA